MERGEISIYRLERRTGRRTAACAGRTSPRRYGTEGATATTTTVNDVTDASGERAREARVAEDATKAKSMFLAK
jgi:hypothetical protein